jgi:hypothetical protein
LIILSVSKQLVPRPKVCQNTKEKLDFLILKSDNKVDLLSDKKALKTLLTDRNFVVGFYKKFLNEFFVCCCHSLGYLLKEILLLDSLVMEYALSFLLNIFIQQSSLLHRGVVSRFHPVAM